MGKIPKKQEIINGTLLSNDECESEMKAIRKHKLMRNAIQHRNRIVDSRITDFMDSQLEILDDEGNSKVYGEGDEIVLSFPSINNLKSAMLVVGQKYKRGLKLD